MADEENGIQIEGLTDEQKVEIGKLVTGAVESTTTALKETFEVDFGKLRSAEQGRNQTLTDKIRQMEVDSAKTTDDASGDRPPVTPLGNEVDKVRARHTQEDADVKRTADDKKLLDRNTELEAIVFDSAKRDALTAKIPEEVVKLAKDADDLGRLTTLYRSMAGNGTDPGENNADGNDPETPPISTGSATLASRGAGKTTSSNPEEAMGQIIAENRRTEAQDRLRSGTQR